MVQADNSSRLSPQMDVEIIKYLSFNSTVFKQSVRSLNIEIFNPQYVSICTGFFTDIVELWNRVQEGLVYQCRRYCRAGLFCVDDHYAGYAPGSVELFSRLLGDGPEGREEKNP
jgi:hypothetical protein